MQKFVTPKPAETQLYQLSQVGGGGRRLCLFAGYCKDGIIPDYVIYYLKKLSMLCEIHYMADSEVSDKEIAKIQPYVKSASAVKHNKYDFGSWQELINMLGWDYIEQFGQLIFANDSCYAPVFPFEDMFIKMEHKNADFWGVTVYNLVKLPHVQSYFIVFNKRIIKEAAFRYFMKNIKKEKSHTEIVNKYEIRLTRLLAGIGYSYASYVDENLVATSFYLKLFLNKSPFIKTKAFLGDFFVIPPVFCFQVLQMLNYPVKYMKDNIKSNINSTIRKKIYLKTLKKLTIFSMGPFAKYVIRFKKLLFKQIFHTEF